MPRRLITSDIFRNEKFGNLSDTARLFFIGCFSNADDDGRLKASPKYLKALLFPYDNNKTPDDIKECRDKCHDIGLIHVYNQNGSEFLYCIGWEEHQSIRKDRYIASKLPAPNTLMPTTCQPDDNQPTTNRLPDVNHVSTTCQPSDNPNPIQSNPIISNIIKGDKKLSPSLEKNENGEKVAEVFARIDKIRGYRPPKRKAEAASIIRMLKTYSTDQIIEIYEILKAEPFWNTKELFLMTVESQIGAVLSGKNGGNNKAPRSQPEVYTRPEDI